MGAADGKKENVLWKIVSGILTGAFIAGAATSYGTSAYYKPKAEELEKALKEANNALASEKEKEKNAPVDPLLKQTQDVLNQCKADQSRIAMIKNDAFSAEISKLVLQQANDIKLIATMHIIGAPSIHTYGDPYEKTDIPTALPANLAVQAAFLQKQIDDDFVAIADMRKKFEYAAPSSSSTSDQTETP